MTTAPAGLAASTGKFAIVGIANNLIGYALFAVLTLLSVPAIPAMTASYCLGMLISYFGNRNFTFNHTGRAGTSVLKFLVVNAAGYSLNAVLLWYFVEHLGFPQLAVQAVAIGCVAVLTFTLMRLWVFKHGTAASDD